MLSIASQPTIHVGASRPQFDFPPQFYVKYGDSPIGNHELSYNNPSKDLGDGISITLENPNRTYTLLPVDIPIYLSSSDKHPCISVISSASLDGEIEQYHTDHDLVDPQQSHYSLSSQQNSILTVCHERSLIFHTISLDAGIFQMVPQHQHAGLSMHHFFTMEFPRYCHPITTSWQQSKLAELLPTSEGDNFQQLYPIAVSTLHHSVLNSFAAHIPSINAQTSTHHPFLAAISVTRVPDHVVNVFTLVIDQLNAQRVGGNQHYSHDACYRTLPIESDPHTAASPSVFADTKGYNRRKQARDKSDQSHEHDHTSSPQLYTFILSFVDPQTRTILFHFPLPCYQYLHSPPCTPVQTPSTQALGSLPQTKAPPHQAQPLQVDIHETGCFSLVVEIAHRKYIVDYMVIFLLYRLFSDSIPGIPSHGAPQDHSDQPDMSPPHSIPLPSYNMRTLCISTRIQRSSQVVLAKPKPTGDEHDHPIGSPRPSLMEINYALDSPSPTAADLYRSLASKGKDSGAGGYTHSHPPLTEQEHTLFSSLFTPHTLAAFVPFVSQIFTSVGRSLGILNYLNHGSMTTPVMNEFLSSLDLRGLLPDDSITFHCSIDLSMLLSWLVLTLTSQVEHYKLQQRTSKAKSTHGHQEDSQACLGSQGNHPPLKAPSAHPNHNCMMTLKTMFTEGSAIDQASTVYRWGLITLQPLLLSLYHTLSPFLSPFAVIASTPCVVLPPQIRANQPPLRGPQHEPHSHGANTLIQQEAVKNSPTIQRYYLHSTSTFYHVHLPSISTSRLLSTAVFPTVLLVPLTITHEMVTVTYISLFQTSTATSARQLSAAIKPAVLSATTSLDGSPSHTIEAETATNSFPSQYDLQSSSRGGGEAKDQGLLIQSSLQTQSQRFLAQYLFCYQVSPLTTLTARFYDHYANYQSIAVGIYHNMNRLLTCAVDLSPQGGAFSQPTSPLSQTATNAPVAVLSSLPLLSHMDQFYRSLVITHHHERFLLSQSHQQQRQRKPYGHNVNASNLERDMRNSLRQTVTSHATALPAWNPPHSTVSFLQNALDQHPMPLDGVIHPLQLAICTLSEQKAYNLMPIMGHSDRDMGFTANRGYFKYNGKFLGCLCCSCLSATLGVVMPETQEDMVETISNVHYAWPTPMCQHRISTASSVISRSDPNSHSQTPRSNADGSGGGSSVDSGNNGTVSPPMTGHHIHSVHMEMSLINTQMTAPPSLPLSLHTLHLLLLPPSQRQTSRPYVLRLLTLHNLLSSVLLYTLCVPSMINPNTLLPSAMSTYALLQRANLRYYSSSLTSLQLLNNVYKTDHCGNTTMIGTIPREHQIGRRDDGGAGTAELDPDASRLSETAGSDVANLQSQQGIRHVRYADAITSTHFTQGAVAKPDGDEIATDTNMMYTRHDRVSSLDPMFYKRLHLALPKPFLPSIVVMMGELYTHMASALSRPQPPYKDCLSSDVDDGVASHTSHIARSKWRNVVSSIEHLIIYDGNLDLVVLSDADLKLQDAEDQDHPSSSQAQTSSVQQTDTVTLLPQGELGLSDSDPVDSDASLVPNQLQYMDSGPLHASHPTHHLASSPMQSSTLMQCMSVPHHHHHQQHHEHGIHSLANNPLHASLETMDNAHPPQCKTPLENPFLTLTPSNYSALSHRSLTPFLDIPCLQGDQPTLLSHQFLGVYSPLELENQEQDVDITPEEIELSYHFTTLHWPWSVMYVTRRSINSLTNAVFRHIDFTGTFEYQRRVRAGDLSVNINNALYADADTCNDIVPNADVAQSENRHQDAAAAAAIRGLQLLPVGAYYQLIDRQPTVQQWVGIEGFGVPCAHNLMAGLAGPDHLPPSSTYSDQPSAHPITEYLSRHTTRLVENFPSGTHFHPTPNISQPDQMPPQINMEHYLYYTHLDNLINGVLHRAVPYLTHSIIPKLSTLVYPDQLYAYGSTKAAHEAFALTSPITASGSPSDPAATPYHFPSLLMQTANNPQITATPVHIQMVWYALLNQYCQAILLPQSYASQKQLIQHQHQNQTQGPAYPLSTPLTGGLASAHPAVAQTLLSMSQPPSVGGESARHSQNLPHQPSTPALTTNNAFTQQSNKVGSYRYTQTPREHIKPLWNMICPPLHHIAFTPHRIIRIANNTILPDIVEALSAAAIPLDDIENRASKQPAANSGETSQSRIDSIEHEAHTHNDPHERPRLMINEKSSNANPTAEDTPSATATTTATTNSSRGGNDNKKKASHYGRAKSAPVNLHDWFKLLPKFRLVPVYLTIECQKVEVVEQPPPPESLPAADASAPSFYSSDASTLDRSVTSRTHHGRRKHPHRRQQQKQQRKQRHRRMNAFNAVAPPNHDEDDVDHDNLSQHTYEGLPDDDENPLEGNYAFESDAVPQYLRDKLITALKRLGSQKSKKTSSQRRRNEHDDSDNDDDEDNDDHDNHSYYSTDNDTASSTATDLSYGGLYGTSYDDDGDDEDDEDDDGDDDDDDNQTETETDHDHYASDVNIDGLFDLSSNVSRPTPHHGSYAAYQLESAQSHGEKHRNRHGGWLTHEYSQDHHDLLYDDEEEDEDDGTTSHTARTRQYLSETHYNARRDDPDDTHGENTETRSLSPDAMSISPQHSANTSSYVYWRNLAQKRRHLRDKTSFGSSLVALSAGSHSTSTESTTTSSSRSQTSVVGGDALSSPHTSNRLHTYDTLSVAQSHHTTALSPDDRGVHEPKASPYSNRGRRGSLNSLDLYPYSARFFRQGQSDDDDDDDDDSNNDDGRDDKDSTRSFTTDVDSEDDIADINAVVTEAINKNVYLKQKHARQLQHFHREQSTSPMVSSSTDMSSGFSSISSLSDSPQTFFQTSSSLYSNEPGVSTHDHTTTVIDGTSEAGSSVHFLTQTYHQPPGHDDGDGSHRHGSEIDPKSNYPHHNGPRSRGTSSGYVHDIFQISGDEASADSSDDGGNDTLHVHHTTSTPRMTRIESDYYHFIEPSYVTSHGLHERAERHRRRLEKYRQQSQSKQLEDQRPPGGNTLLANNNLTNEAIDSARNQAPSSPVSASASAFTQHQGGRRPTQAYSFSHRGQNTQGRTTSQSPIRDKETLVTIGDFQLDKSNPLIRTMFSLSSASSQSDSASHSSGDRSQHTIGPLPSSYRQPPPQRRRRTKLHRHHSLMQIHVPYSSKNFVSSKGHPRDVNTTSSGNHTYSQMEQVPERGRGQRGRQAPDSQQMQSHEGNSVSSFLSTASHTINPPSQWPPSHRHVTRDYAVPLHERDGGFPPPTASLIESKTRAKPLHQMVPSTHLALSQQDIPQQFKSGIKSKVSRPRSVTLTLEGLPPTVASYSSVSTLVPLIDIITSFMSHASGPTMDAHELPSAGEGPATRPPLHTNRGDVDQTFEEQLMLLDSVIAYCAECFRDKTIPLPLHARESSGPAAQKIELYFHPNYPGISRTHHINLHILLELKSIYRLVYIYTKTGLCAIEMLNALSQSQNPLVHLVIGGGYSHPSRVYHRVYGWLMPMTMEIEHSILHVVSLLQAKITQQVVHNHLLGTIFSLLLTQMKTMAEASSWPWTRHFGQYLLISLPWNHNVENSYTTAAQEMFSMFSPASGHGTPLAVVMFNMRKYVSPDDFMRYYHYITERCLLYSNRSSGDAPPSGMGLDMGYNRQLPSKYQQQQGVHITQFSTVSIGPSLAQARVLNNGYHLRRALEMSRETTHTYAIHGWKHASPYLLLLSRAGALREQSLRGEVANAAAAADSTKSHHAYVAYQKQLRKHFAMISRVKQLSQIADIMSPLQLHSEGFLMEIYGNTQRRIWMEAYELQSTVVLLPVLATDVEITRMPCMTDSREIYGHDQGLPSTGNDHHHPTHGNASPNAEGQTDTHHRLPSVQLHEKNHSPAHHTRASRSVFSSQTIDDDEPLDSFRGSKKSLKTHHQPSQVIQKQHHRSRLVHDLPAGGPLPGTSVKSTTLGLDDTERLSEARSDYRTTTVLDKPGEKPHVREKYLTLVPPPTKPRTTYPMNQLYQIYNSPFVTGKSSQEIALPALGTPHGAEQNPSTMSSGAGSSRKTMTSSKTLSHFHKSNSPAKSSIKPATHQNASPHLMPLPPSPRPGLPSPAHHPQQLSEGRFLAESMPYPALAGGGQHQQDDKSTLHGDLQHSHGFGGRSSPSIRAQFRASGSGQLRGSISTTQIFELGESLATQNTSTTSLRAPHRSTMQLHSHVHGKSTPHLDHPQDGPASSQAGMPSDEPHTAVSHAIPVPQPTQRFSGIRVIPQHDEHGNLMLTPQMKPVSSHGMHSPTQLSLRSTAPSDLSYAPPPSATGEGRHDLDSFVLDSAAPPVDEHTMVRPPSVAPGRPHASSHVETINTGSDLTKQSASGHTLQSALHVKSTPNLMATMIGDSGVFSNRSSRGGVSLQHQYHAGGDQPHPPGPPSTAGNAQSMVGKQPTPRLVPNTSRLHMLNNRFSSLGNSNKSHGGPTTSLTPARPARASAWKRNHVEHDQRDDDRADKTSHRSFTSHLGGTFDDSLRVPGLNQTLTQSDTMVYTDSKATDNTQVILQTYLPMAGHAEGGLPSISRGELTCQKESSHAKYSSIHSSPVHESQPAKPRRSVVFPYVIARTNTQAAFRYYANQNYHYIIQAQHVHLMRQLHDLERTQVELQSSGLYPPSWTGLAPGLDQFQKGALPSPRSPALMAIPHPFEIPQGAAEHGVTPASLLPKAIYSPGLGPKSSLLAVFGHGQSTPVPSNASPSPSLQTPVLEPLNLPVASQNQDRDYPPQTPRTAAHGAATSSTVSSKPPGGIPISSLRLTPPLEPQQPPSYLSHPLRNTTVSSARATGDLLTFAQHTPYYSTHSSKRLQPSGLPQGVSGTSPLPESAHPEHHHIPTSGVGQLPLHTLVAKAVTPIPPYFSLATRKIPPLATEGWHMLHGLTPYSYPSLLTPPPLEPIHLRYRIDYGDHRLLVHSTDASSHQDMSERSSTSVSGGGPHAPAELITPNLTKGLSNSLSHRSAAMPPPWPPLSPSLSVPHRSTSSTASAAVPALASTLAFTRVARTTSPTIRFLAGVSHALGVTPLHLLSPLALERHLEKQAMANTLVDVPTDAMSVAMKTAMVVAVQQLHTFVQRIATSMTSASTPKSVRMQWQGLLRRLQKLFSTPSQTWKLIVSNATFYKLFISSLSTVLSHGGGGGGGKRTAGRQPYEGHGMAVRTHPDCDSLMALPSLHPSSFRVLLQSLSYLATGTSSELDFTKALPTRVLEELSRVLPRSAIETHPLVVKTSPYGSGVSASTRSSQPASGQHPRSVAGMPPQPATSSSQEGSPVGTQAWHNSNEGRLKHALAGNMASRDSHDNSIYPTYTLHHRSTKDPMIPDFNYQTYHSSFEKQPAFLSLTAAPSSIADRSGVFDSTSGDYSLYSQPTLSSGVGSDEHRAQSTSMSAQQRPGAMARVGGTHVGPRSDGTETTTGGEHSVPYIALIPVVIQTYKVLRSLPPNHILVSDGFLTFFSNILLRFGFISQSRIILSKTTMSVTTKQLLTRPKQEVHHADPPLSLTKILYRYDEGALEAKDHIRSLYTVKGDASAAGVAQTTRGAEPESNRLQVTSKSSATINITCEDDAEILSKEHHQALLQSVKSPVQMETTLFTPTRPSMDNHIYQESNSFTRYGHHLMVSPSNSPTNPMYAADHPAIDHHSHADWNGYGSQQLQHSQPPDHVCQGVFCLECVNSSVKSISYRQYTQTVLQNALEPATVRIVAPGTTPHPAIPPISEQHPSDNSCSETHLWLQLSQTVLAAQSLALASETHETLCNTIISGITTTADPAHRQGEQTASLDRDSQELLELYQSQSRHSTASGSTTFTMDTGLQQHQPQSRSQPTTPYSITIPTTPPLDVLMSEQVGSAVVSPTVIEGQEAVHNDMVAQKPGENGVAVGPSRLPQFATYSTPSQASIASISLLSHHPTLFIPLWNAFNPCAATLHYASTLGPSPAAQQHHSSSHRSTHGSFHPSLHARGSAGATPLPPANISESGSPSVTTAGSASGSRMGDSYLNTDMSVGTAPSVRGQAMQALSRASRMASPPPEKSLHEMHIHSLLDLSFELREYCQMTSPSLDHNRTRRILSLIQYELQRGGMRSKIKRVPKHKQRSLIGTLQARIIQLSSKLEFYHHVNRQRYLRTNLFSVLSRLNLPFNVLEYPILSQTLSMDSIREEILKQRASQLSQPDGANPIRTAHENYTQVIRELLGEPVDSPFANANTSQSKRTEVSSQSQIEAECLRKGSFLVTTLVPPPRTELLAIDNTTPSVEVDPIYAALVIQHYSQRHWGVSLVD